MKVLFLDIDGVLNSIGRARAYSGTELRNGGMGFPCQLEHSDAMLDRNAVAILRRFVELHGFKIVLSSSWRSGDAAADIALFKTAFAREFDWPDFPMIGITPRLEQKWIRGVEVNRWICMHGGQCRDYVIIDDESDFTNHQKKFHLYQTDMDEGLTWGIFSWYDKRQERELSVKEES